MTNPSLDPDNQRYPSLDSQRRWISSVFLPSLLPGIDIVALGDVLDGGSSGIFSPKDRIDHSPLGVTSQFLDNPEDYHHVAEDGDHSEWLLKNAIERIACLPKNPLILDVGCGAGNTALGILNIFDDAIVVAADVSHKLLHSLTTIADKHPRGRSVVPLCVDLNEPRFADEKFDMVVGRAILHHLFDPENLISNVYHSVKVGGSLIFFEPYECGYSIFSGLIDLIIETSNRLPGLSDSVRRFLEGTLAEYQTCEPKDPMKYAGIDDKWNFTRTYFETIADRLGAKLQVYALYGSDSPFTDQLIFRLKAGFGTDRDALPDWAWALVDRFEKRVSRNALDEMTCAVGVIFTKLQHQTNAQTG